MHFSCVGYPDQKKEGEAFVKSIMKDYVDIPNSNGMRVLNDILDIETNSRGNVVLRNITEKFWREVIEATKTHRVCAVGTPGIGKTTTTCIPIRFLLEEKKTVVYRVRRIGNKGYVYMFIPTLDEVIVKVIREVEFDSADTNVNKADIYYVVDPGKTDDNCNLDDNFTGKIIIVASPDSVHWGRGDFGKQRGRSLPGIFLFHPVWELDELITSKQYFRYSLNDDVVIYRYEKVGGIPRHIFTDVATFDGIMINQVAALNKLDEKQLEKMAENDITAVQTFDRSQPGNLLMVYKCPDNNYHNFIVSAVSQHVLTEILKRNEIYLWNVMVSRGVNWGGFGWKMFEAYCQRKMLGNVREFLDVHRHDGNKLVRSAKLWLGGCQKIEGTRRNLIDAANGKENVVFYSICPSHDLFDFVYKEKSTYHAFQVTVGKDHSCNRESLLKNASQAGALSNFYLYYLVYDTKYPAFKLKPANPTRQLRHPHNKEWHIYSVRIPSPQEAQNVNEPKKAKRSTDTPKQTASMTYYNTRSVVQSRKSPPLSTTPFPGNILDSTQPIDSNDKKPQSRKRLR